MTGLVNEQKNAGDKISKALFSDRFIFDEDGR